MPYGETTRAKQTVAFFTLLLVYLASGALASQGMSFLFVTATVFFAAGAAALMRSLPLLLAAVPPLFGIALGVLLAPSPSLGVFSVVAPILAFILAGGVRRGEGRVSMTATATLVLSLLFLLWGAWELLYSAYTLGKTDVLAYLGELIDGMRDALVAYEEEAYRFIIAFVEQDSSGIAVTMPSTDALTEAASFYMSLLPGMLLLLVAGVAFAATYVLELFARAANNPRIFSPKNAVTRVSATSAILYLAALLTVLVYEDPASVFYLTVINLVIFFTPALAVIKLQDAKRFFGFLRRFTIGHFDFAVWLTLSVIGFFLYLRYVLLILAVWQAISILKSAFGKTPESGRP